MSAIAPTDVSAARPAALGFIGLGLMGEPMARNLVRAGFPVVVYNRSSAAVDRLVREGATAATSPAAVAAVCDVIVTMLPDGPDVEAVVLASRGVLDTLRPGSLVIDMSTISPLVARDLAVATEARGGQFIDAPVSGGEVGARDGTLSIMAGGDSEAVGRAQPIFDVLGQSAVHVGPVGAGQLVKAANQMLVAGTIALVGEAITFVEEAGVDPAAALAVISKGLGGNRVLDVKGPRMLDGDYTPGFRMELQRKDLHIALEECGRLELSLRLAPLVADLVERAVQDGMADCDHSALLVEVRRLARRNN